MATGHIRRIAPVNQDRTRSGVSRLMHACYNTFVQKACQTLFGFRRFVAEPGVPDRSRREEFDDLAPVVGLSGVPWTSNRITSFYIGWVRI